MQQKLDLQLRGLYTSPNNLSGVPAGALEIADNLVINAKSLVESRRGQTQYNNPVTVGAGKINKLFNYSSSLILNYDDKMAYDNGSGAWIDYSGTYLTPDSGHKIRSLEALKNFYFTTSKGIYKIDSLTGTPRTSGVVKALGGTGSTTGSTGFLADDSAVAYRILWGYTDANQNLILGAPSQRIVVSNSTGGTKDVSLTFQIPDTITTSYFYQVYRSFGTVGASLEPSDELQLVLQANPTSGQISAKSITVLDSTPYSLMRATLYTSPSQEGIANENNQPPFAVDMDVFKTCAFYANIKQKQSLTLALLGVGVPSIYYSTQSLAHTHTNTIIDNIFTGDLKVGMRVVGSGVQADTRIVSVDSSSQVTVSKATTATATVSLEFQDRFTIAGVDYWAGSSESVATNQFFAQTGGTPGVNINTTALSIVNVINKSASNTTVYAYYLSSQGDLPGQMLFQERAIGGTSFSVTSTAGSTAFSPTVPSSGTTVSSENEARQNRVLVSKPGQVEAVPIYRFFDIGSANFPIQRVVALRDGIFFFKSDGIYRLSGETFESFTVTLLDNTVILKVPESAVPFNNQVFCFTTQAICAVTDAGVQIMSVPIETDLLELSSDQFTNFVSSSFGVAYESSRQYIFFTVTNETDTYATQGFIYNSLTDSWTRWPMSRTCGIVNTSVNKLFMAKAGGGQVMIERKSYTNDDYADEQYDVTIASVDSSTSLTLANTDNVRAGMSLVQGARKSIIVFVSGLVVTIEETRGLVAGAATVFTPILNKLKWAPIDADNPGYLKQFSEISLFFRNAAFSKIKDVEFATNIYTAGESVEITNNNFPEAWGKFQWGDVPWGGQLGGQSVLRTYVPRNSQRGSWLTLSLETEEAFTGFSLQGVSIIYNVMSTRLR